MPQKLNSAIVIMKNAKVRGPTEVSIPGVMDRFAVFHMVRRGWLIYLLSGVIFLILINSKDPFVITYE